MILSEKVKIKIHGNNKKHLEEKGYDVSEYGKIIEINPKDLSKGSHVKIKVKCDNPKCGKEKEITFQKYYKNTKGLTIDYTCGGKCSTNKRKLTCLEKYDTECPLQNKTISEKTIKTNFEKYGFEYSSSSPIVKEKRKNTNLERYDIDIPSKLEEFKNKQKQTNLEKYGVEWSKQYIPTKEKSIKTCLEKYGYENVFQNEEIQEKQKQTLFDRYGVLNPAQIKTHGEKCRKYWGYDNPLNKESFDDFKKLVVNRTKKHKKHLLENWNGYDYYTGEYIYNNFELYNPNDDEYPNTDHKISIKYGFDNGYSIEELSSYDNLCITTRKNNIKKSSKIEKEYTSYLEK